MIARRSLLTFFAVAVLSAILTCAFSARETTITADEWIYQEAGLHYLNGGSFSMNFEHPPLSKWTGALWPYISGERNLTSFRLFHIFLYALTGVLAFEYFYRKRLYLSAFVWTLLYFFCPNFKALSSLHVMDADVALYAMLCVLSFYEFYSVENLKRKAWFLTASAFFLTLTITTKFTGLFLLPFFLGATFYFLRRTNLKAYRIWGGIFLAVAVGFLLAYLFRPSEVLWYGKGIDAQKLHNRAADHATSMFGQITTHGYWYYYLVSFFFKSTLLQLLLIFSIPLLVLRQGWRPARKSLFFFVPAFALLFYLSRLNVQLGYRYALPFTGLLFLGISLLASQLKNWEAKVLRPGVIALTGVLFLGADLHTLSRQDYLSFFNLLAPRPTRNFADGNNDWGQKLPSRLSRDLGWVVDIDDVRLVEVLGRMRQDPSLLNLPTLFAVGASDLAGLFRPEGFYFRDHEPEAVRGAFELHRLTWAEYLLILLKHDLLAKKRFENPTPEEIQRVSQGLHLCNYRLRLEDQRSGGPPRRRWIPVSEAEAPGATEFSFPCP